MNWKKYSIAIVISSTILTLTGCQNSSLNAQSEKTAQEAIAPKCDSFNKDDNLASLINVDNSSSLKLKVPLARFRKEDGRGISTVLLPSSSDETKIFWVHKNAEDKWMIAEKQTVAQIQSGEIDAQFFHRLDPNIFPRFVFFVAIPQKVYLDKEILIEPVLNKENSRRGNKITYPVKLNAQGISHPFSGLNKSGLSGDVLPDRFQNVLNKLESKAGSIFVPDTKFTGNDITILQPSLMNPQLCPSAGNY